jgi:hypothetical protein
VKEIMPEEEKPSMPLRVGVGTALIIMHLVCVCVDGLLFLRIRPESWVTDSCADAWIALLSHMGFAFFFLLLGIGLILWRLPLPKGASIGSGLYCSSGVALMGTNVFLYLVPMWTGILLRTYLLPTACIPGWNLFPLYLLHFLGFLVGLGVTIVGLLHALQNWS